MLHTPRCQRVGALVFMVILASGEGFPLPCSILSQLSLWQRRIPLAMDSGICMYLGCLYPILFPPLLRSDKVQQVHNLFIGLHIRPAVVAIHPRSFRPPASAALFQPYSSQSPRFLSEWYLFVRYWLTKSARRRACRCWCIGFLSAELHALHYNFRHIAFAAILGIIASCL